MHDDPAAEMRAALDAKAAKTRKRFLIGAIAVGVLVAGGSIGWTLWPTGAKRLAEAEPFIAETRPKYCAIGEAVAGEHGPRPLTNPPSEALFLPGYLDLHGDHSRPETRTNTDGADLSELTRLCPDAEGRAREAEVFFPLFSRLDRVGSPGADDYSVAGVEAALETQRAIEWLVVVVPTYARESEVIDHATFDAGELRANAWLCHLDRGCLGSVSVQARGPLSATSYGVLDADTVVALETRQAFQRGVLRALREAGVRIEDPTS